MPNNYNKWSPEKIKEWNKLCREYSKKHYVTVSFKLNKETEKDIVDYFYDENGKARKSISSQIKKLVRDDINKK